MVETDGMDLMSRTNLVDLYQDIELELPSCPQPVILRQVHKTIREFCEETLAWQGDADPVNVREGVSLYELTGPDNQAEIVQFKEVWRRYAADEDLVLLAPPLYNSNGVLINGGWERISRCQIGLVSEPDSSVKHGLEIIVALRPKMTAVSICTELYDRWQEVWACGVKGVLMMMPKKKWTDQAMGQFYHKLWLDGKADARIDQLRGGTLGDFVALPKEVFA